MEGDEFFEESVSRVAALEEQVLNVVAEQEGLVTLMVFEQSDSKVLQLEERLEKMEESEALEESISRVSALEEQFSSIVADQDGSITQPQQTAVEDLSGSKLLQLEERLVKMEQNEDLEKSVSRVTALEKRLSSFSAQQTPSSAAEDLCGSKLLELEERLVKVEGDDGLDESINRVTALEERVWRALQAQQAVAQSPRSQVDLLNLTQPNRPVVSDTSPDMHDSGNLAAMPLSPASPVTSARSLQLDDLKEVRTVHMLEHSDVLEPNDALELDKFVQSRLADLGKAIAKIESPPKSPSKSPPKSRSSACTQSKTPPKTPPALSCGLAASPGAMSPGTALFRCLCCCQLCSITMLRL